MDRAGACARLASTMAAYDPLSYHNGSVWPHDTAICAAGAARYGRWDVVDRIVDGALRRRDRVRRPPTRAVRRHRSQPRPRMPVAYPSSCSPQAWSSASILLLVRTMLDLRPSSTAWQWAGPTSGECRTCGYHGIRCGDRRFDVEVRDSEATVTTAGVAHR